MGFCIVTTTHSVGRTVFYMLQQPIRWAEWSFTCCNTISYACKPLLHRLDGLSAVAERLFPQYSNHVL